MFVKLRQIGNSLGVIVPASELKEFNAEPGDTLELQIIKVVRNQRYGWGDPNRWLDALPAQVVVK